VKRPNISNAYDEPQALWQTDTVLRPQRRLTPPQVLTTSILGLIFIGTLMLASPIA
jgi:hypothetical protein